MEPKSLDVVAPPDRLLAKSPTWAGGWTDLEASETPSSRT